ncbi:MAG: hypothetical protein QM791_06130 [Ferruginibacter sp.]
MSKADYTHSIEKFQGFNAIVIEDLDLGNKSVTNDIENVVEDIAVMEKIKPAEHVILYNDSQGWWDGWDQFNKRFIALNATSWKNAVIRLRDKMLEKNMATA